MKISKLAENEDKRTIEQVTDNKFLNIKKVIDPEHGIGGYFFAERLGTDSIAFICVDKEFPEKVLLNNEYKPPNDEFILGAFGGSLDKEKTPKAIAVEEVKQEAGYVVTEDDITDLGKVLVSTQMNQYCHLFVVKVDGDEEPEREPENPCEALAETEWIDKSKVSELKDWKAITIVAKAEAKGLM